MPRWSTSTCVRSWRRRDRRGERSAEGQGLLVRAPERGRRPAPGQGAAQGHEDPQPVLRHRGRRAAGRPRLPTAGGGAGEADPDPARDPRLVGGPMITKSPLANADLLREQAWLNGEWVDADSGETFPVTNPATGEELAHVPRMGAAETRRALEAAEAAFPGWRGRTAADRARTMRRWADLMLEHLDDLALLLTLEQGKPLAESEAEIRYAPSFLEWFGEEGKRVYGDTIPSPLPDRRIVVLKQPVGVSGGITPWNFPSAMPTRKAAPALAAGCTMVLKPAEQTPLSALAVAVLAEEAGLPPGGLRRQPRHRGCACDRRRDDLEPARPQGRLHRLERGRQAADGPVREGPEEDLARARRQRAVRRLRRRRPRRGGRRHRRLQVPQLRPDVHLREPDPRPRGDLRRLPGAAGRGGRGVEGRRRHRAGREDRAVDRGRGARQGDAARRERGRGRCRAARRRRAPRARPHVLPADRAHRPDRRDGDEPRGDLRPRGRDLPVRDRGGGRADRERHAVRPLRVLLQSRCRPRLARVGGARLRHR